MLVPVLAVVAVIAVLALLTAFFHAGYPAAYYGPPYYGWGIGFPYFGFGWFFITPLFFLFFFGLRWFFWGGWGWGRGWYRQYYDPAMETLRERFARGEISKEQFDKMAKDLGGQ